jgi:hypothetical protein
MDLTARERATCPNCGTKNEAGRSLCEQCNTPLTAYAGQLTGESYQGRLADQVARLEQRPLPVTGMTVFLLIYALFWPIASVIGAFNARVKINAEGTNYLAASFSAIGPFLSALILLPIAGALCFLAWATWAQRPWAWNLCLAVVGLFGVLGLLKFSLLGFVWGFVAVGLTVVWLRPDTRAWFGQH